MNKRQVYYASFTAGVGLWVVIETLLFPGLDMLSGFLIALAFGATAGRIAYSIAQKRK